MMSAPLPASARRENPAGTDHERFNFVGSLLIPAGQKNPFGGARNPADREAGALTAQQAAAANHFGGGGNDRQ
jgi:hypothetical protein